MGRFSLTEKERLTLYGLVRYPHLKDKELSKKLNLKHSTITSIRRRLWERGYFRKLIVPKFERIGCKMLVAIYTNFSPLIPLEERVEITEKTIEAFEEIFFSVGEQDKGFSLSISRDYATIGHINDVRTLTFGGRGLLEEDYPHMVVFPFEISKIYRFFDYAPLLRKSFRLDLEEEKEVDLDQGYGSTLSDTEKNVLCMLVGYPEMSESWIARELGVSRHTVSRLRRGFDERALIERLTIPNQRKLGFEILAFYHFRFDPRNPPKMENDEGAVLMSDSTIFLATRVFEAIMISIYSDYNDYKSDQAEILKVLRENRWISKEPLIRTYGVNTMAFIKEFKFAPLTKKIVGCDPWVKKLLNM
jgi:DNA-binding MarR family transcriptional regulator